MRKIKWVLGDFTLSELTKILGLTINETLDLFAASEKLESSEYLAFNLPENIALAVAINITVVESKNENLRPSFDQCVYEMLPEQLFNEREGNAIKRIYSPRF